MTENTQKKLLIVYSGAGKGKSTAALGACLRSVGHGWRSCIIQFIKGSWKTGETESVKLLAPQVELHQVGRGFVGIIDDDKDINEHQQAALEGLEFARKKIESGDYQLVVLDELNVVIDLGLASREVIEPMLAAARKHCHMIVTGRGAPDWLIEQAELVTEMKEIKHPFQQGIKAQEGIDW